MTSLRALWGHMHRTCTPHSSARAVKGHGAKQGCRFERWPLGSHVAVRDGSPLALPAYCTAGDDGGHRERHRRNQEPALLRRLLQMGWLGGSRVRWCMALSIYHAAVVLVGCLTLILMARTPRLPMWTAAFFWEFAGQVLSGPVGGAPVSFYGWHYLETSQAWPECSENGLIGRSPTTSVGTSKP